MGGFKGETPTLKILLDTNIIFWMELLLQSARLYECDCADFYAQPND